MQAAPYFRVRTAVVHSALVLEVISEFVAAIVRGHKTWRPFIKAVIVTAIIAGLLLALR